MIKLRAAREKDLPMIAAIYMPYVTGSAVSFETRPPSAEDMGKRMAQFGGLYPWLVATSDDDHAVIGYAYATRFRDRPAYKYIVETALYLGGGVEGQGVGRLLYRALIDTLIAQDFTQAIAVLSLPNDHGISLLEATGFQRAGYHREVGYKNGRWHDVGFWQRELAQPGEPPLDPKPFKDVGIILPTV